MDTELHAKIVALHEQETALSPEWAARLAPLLAACNQELPG
ncbi:MULTISPECIES: hypothetical protein [Streptomyces]|nr:MULTISPECIES: hypothetical protein [Streptomyces]MCR8945269.1 hypothetical protein [Streptomyces sp. OUCMDZ-4982]MDI7788860.1 hypothetical protein [Streptomyces cavourensis]